MARNRYEYGTTPRKLESTIKEKSNTKRNNIKVVKNEPRQKVKVSQAQRKKQKNLTLVVIAIFVLLLTISYRNSQINEEFTQMQNMKRELSSLEKENEQLKVSIENSLNLNNIEKLAKEKLGMQKLTNKQTVYVSLPKKDYVEVAPEKIVKEQQKSWFEKFVDKLMKK